MQAIRVRVRVRLRVGLRVRVRVRVPVRGSKDWCTLVSGGDLERWRAPLQSSFVTQNAAAVPYGVEFEEESLVTFHTAGDCTAKDCTETDTSEHSE